MPAAQAKHTQPTFTINEQPGWNTRLLYTYYGHNGSANLIDYVTETGGSFTGNIFDVIGNFATSANIFNHKGSVAFPAVNNFLKTGKTLRVEGSLWVSSTGGQFNMRASVENSTNGVVLLAAQNNNNNHDLTTVDLMPVFFKIDFSSVETNDNGTKELYLMANGYYEYCKGNYDTGGKNDTLAFIPIYNKSNTTPYISLGNANSNNKLYISFDGSSNISSIKIIHLTVEELQ